MTNRQISEEIYAKAEQFLEWNVEKKVFHPFVSPQWNSDGSTFWYQKRSRQGYSFHLVNPLEQISQPAFDHERIAQSLSEKLRAEIHPFQLPFDSFFYSTDQTIIYFFIQSILFCCELDSYVCYAVDSSHIPAICAVRSPNGCWDLFLEEGNLFLLSTENAERWDWTVDKRSGFSYRAPPDTNLSFILRKQQEAISPPLALWSPDGKKVLSHRIDQHAVSTLPLIQHAPKDSYRPKKYEYHYPFVADRALATQTLLVFDTETKACTLLQTPPIFVEVFSLIEMNWVWWGEDSQTIYFLYEDRGAKRLSFCCASAEDGSVCTILTEESEEYVEPSPLIPWVCYAQVFSQSDQFLWLSEKEGWAHLYLYQLSTGKCLCQITDGPWNVTKVLGVDEQEGWIYFVACGRENHRDPYYPHCYRIRLDGTQMKLLTATPAAHYIHLSPSKKVIVDNYSTLSMEVIPSTEVLTNEGNKLLDLEQGDLNALFAMGWRPPTRFSGKARDGKTPIYGALYFPTHFDSEKKYPIIDLVFAGPQLLNTTKGFVTNSHVHPEFWPGPWFAQALAELGFLVTTIDGLGTPLRSRAFHHASYGKLEEACGLEDHVHVIRELVSEHPYMDVHRVGIFGHGAGGYAAVRALILFPDFYRVAVASSGDHDLLCYLAYWGEKYQGLFSPDRYRNQSNTSWVHRIQGKLLLAHGEMDETVHPCSTFRLIQALIQANKDFDFLFLPNEGHWSYENPYFLRRCWDFFVRHLLGKEPPREYRIRGREEVSYEEPVTHLTV